MYVATGQVNTLGAFEIAAQAVFWKLCMNVCMYVCMYVWVT